VTANQREQGTDWFAAARLGLFIHWGIASVTGHELSWPLAGGIPVLPHSTGVPVAKYYEDAAHFRPPPGAPAQWTALARAAGMRYAVLTAKHHDGFALWDTKTTDFSLPGARGTDIVGEYVEACRADGLRPGLYFSLADWHHADYPAMTDDDRPYPFTMYRRPSAQAWDRFTEVLFAQIRELLTNYGPIDVIWFDGGWERMPNEWRATELAAMIRDLQPQIAINDRLPGVAGYTTPEQFVPAEPPAGVWETCLTMNASWGYAAADTDYKSAREIVQTACEVASRGGNLLLNVAPRADGTLPPEQTERLRALGAWMDRNGESIHDTVPGFAPWQCYGSSTRSGDRWYVHLLLRPYETVTVRGVPIKRVTGVEHVGSGTPLEFRTRSSVLDEMFNSDPMGEVSVHIPGALVDDAATVIALDIAPG
jgi:alpha-L-fucosidase